LLLLPRNLCLHLYPPPPPLLLLVLVLLLMVLTGSAHEAWPQHLWHQPCRFRCHQPPQPPPPLLLLPGRGPLAAGSRLLPAAVL
jgi:hypothetical protein